MIIEIMDKQIAAIEISTEAVKLLVGYELSGQPIVLYSKKIPCKAVDSGANIIDRPALIEVLKQFHKISDEEAHLKLNIDEVSLILPSAALGVFTNVKTSTIVSPDFKVGKIDVSNVISQMRKDLPPEGNDIVDIIPDVYYLDGKRASHEAPIGESGTSLTISAKVYVLPSLIARGYGAALQEAGFRVKMRLVAAYAYAELFKNYSDIPETYLLLDIGANITTVSLVGRGSPYSAMSFSLGSNSLTNKIAETFNIPFEKADSLKTDRGYDPRKISYNPPIANSHDEYGYQKSYYQEDLNELILGWLDYYTPMLEQAMTGALSPVKEGKETIPVLVTGGGSLLNGLEGLLALRLSGRELKVVGPRALGARDPSFGALLGLIAASGHYKGSLEENKASVASVDRVEEKPMKRRRDSDENDIL